MDTDETLLNFPEIFPLRNRGLDFMVYSLSKVIILEVMHKLVQVITLYFGIHIWVITLIENLLIFFELRELL